jgi:hypothetical protein
MSRISEMKSFRSPDGTNWGVQAELAGASNALIVFHHPDGRTSHKDRYAWINWHGPEASNVQANIHLDAVRAKLTDALLESLFRRSALIGGGRGPAFSPA